MALLVAVIAILSSCSSSGEASDPTNTTVESANPEVVVPEGPAPTEVTTEDLTEGDGPEFTDDAFIRIRYVGVLFDTGEEFSSRWDGASFDFTSGTEVAIPGLEEGLERMKVGGQRQIVVPADKAYSDVERQGIPADSDLVFLVELVYVFTEPEIENIDEPVSELETEVLVEGSGEEVQADDLIEIHYKGVAQSTGEVFDSSWLRGAPQEFGLAGLIPGWQEGLAGQKVGSSVKLTIPGELAYGEDGGPGIAPNETLIFVIDILDASAAPPAPEGLIPGSDTGG